MYGAEKIFTTEQIKKADQYTIAFEPISSIDLMERAAKKCTEWLVANYPVKKCIKIFCGPGNNGGDGLAMARMLVETGVEVKVFIINESGKFSDDFGKNLQRVEKIKPKVIVSILTMDDFPIIHSTDLVIDAIFGTGLHRPITGISADCILQINNSGAKIIAIDIPSGLFAEVTSKASKAIIQATHTLSFQFAKLAFFFPENESYLGHWHILDIELHKKIIADEPATHYLLTEKFIKTFIKPRTKFSHKGTYGHALLIAGSYGKMGAAVLAAKACLRSGVGLLTVQVPGCGYQIMQVTNPEAMIGIDSHEKLIGDEIDVDRFSSIGIGPGMGTDEITKNFLHSFLRKRKQPLVLDADALNMISLDKDLLKMIPAHSILTPHPKEFERLAGKTHHDFEKHELQIRFSKENQLFIILKGAHTCITTPDGISYFNTTGNPGMAKGGTGDILTGVITGLLAQGYSSLHASLIGVFVHGIAGDLAAKQMGEIGMIAGDICKLLPEAYKKLSLLDVEVST